MRAGEATTPTTTTMTVRDGDGGGGSAPVDFLPRRGTEPGGERVTRNGQPGTSTGLSEMQDLGYESCRHESGVTYTTRKTIIEGDIILRRGRPWCPFFCAGCPCSFGGALD